MPIENPYDLGDIHVFGQRARGPSPFSGLTFPSKGSSPSVHQTQLPEDPNYDPASDQTLQCQDPIARKQWEADAKAKEAAIKFRQKAQDDFNELDLSNREFGALICQMPGGQIDLGPIRAGEPILDANGNAIDYYPLSRPSVPIPYEDCGSGTPIGMIHSHPGVNVGIPSDADFAYLDGLATTTSVPVSSLGVYVVYDHLDIETTQRGEVIKRSAFSERTAANAGEDVGRFIDPDAEMCPA